MGYDPDLCSSEKDKAVWKEKSREILDGLIKLEGDVRLAIASENEEGSMISNWVSTSDVSELVGFYEQVVVQCDSDFAKFKRANHPHYDHEGNLSQRYSGYQSSIATPLSGAMDLFKQSNLALNTEKHVLLLTSDGHDNYTKTSSEGQGGAWEYPAIIKILERDPSVSVYGLDYKKNYFDKELFTLNEAFLVIQERFYQQLRMYLRYFGKTPESLDDLETCLMNSHTTNFFKDAKLYIEFLEKYNLRNEFERIFKTHLGWGSSYYIESKLEQLHLVGMYLKNQVFFNKTQFNMTFFDSDAFAYKAGSFEYEFIKNNFHLYDELLKASKSFVESPLYLTSGELLPELASEQYKNGPRHSYEIHEASELDRFFNSFNQITRCARP